jgi:ribosomal protein S18 acetylase RimI-like enzyme
MQMIKRIVLISLSLIGVVLAFYLYRGQNGSTLKIENFVFDKDALAVDQLFHQGDNWYWMIYNGGQDTYSLDFTLRNATSSQHEKRHDMIFKVGKINDKIVGFLAYYPESKHVWGLRFLIVDQEIRRQGLAKKLLKYAMDDMVSRGAIRIDLATRNNNFKAQNLYKGFGFTIVRSDYEFVHLSWCKK